MSLTFRFVSFLQFSDLRTNELTIGEGTCGVSVKAPEVGKGGKPQVEIFCSLVPKKGLTRVRTQMSNFLWRSHGGKTHVDSMRSPCSNERLEGGLEMGARE
jgi:hypothetical protein